MMPSGLMDHFPLALRFSSRTLIHGALMVAGFGHQLLVAGPARRFEFAGFERRGHRTVWLARVRAVVKPALARERSDAGKHIVDRVLPRPKGQFTEARCVDQRAAVRQFDEHAASRSVAAARIGLPHGLSGLPRFPQQGFGNRDLPAPEEPSSTTVRPRITPTIGA